MDYTDSVINTSYKNKFEVPGSRVQYSPSIPFIIDKMWLSIKPNFEKKTLTDCIQQLLITAKEDIKEIRLDIAELKIHKILLLPSSLVYPSSSYSISDISIDSRDDDEVNEVIGIKNRTCNSKENPR